MTEIDITGKIGPLFDIAGESPNAVRNTIPAWPMFSYDRPAYLLWNSIADTLHKAGYTEGEIRVWLQSKSARLALDGTLGEAIEKLGKSFAKKEIISKKNDRKSYLT